MPIANCFVSQNCSENSGDLIKIWADESGQSSEHMTINIISTKEQRGHQYSVMANLLLPSMWSKVHISSLQVGLAKALAEYFSIAIEQVHVVTNIIESSLVVENGQEITW